jgi:hypothetical protein
MNSTKFKVVQKSLLYLQYTNITTIAIHNNDHYHDKGLLQG